MTDVRYGLTDEQMALLLSPLHPGRVQKDGKGMSHLTGWDVRRWLTRIFGFVGWSHETLSTTLVREGETRLKNGPGWLVVYRVEVRLTIKNLDGVVLTTFDDGAVGSAKLPSYDDAHDMAFKTALTQALKRCAMNLGDQFGLSLYNKGSLDPVVIRTATWSPVQEAQGAAELPQDDVRGDEELLSGDEDEDGDYSATIGLDAEGNDLILFEALKRETQTATTQVELAAAGERVKANLKKLSQAQIKELQQYWKETNTLLVMDAIDGQIEALRQGALPATRETHKKIMENIEKAELDHETDVSFVKQLNEAFDWVSHSDADEPQ